MITHEGCRSRRSRLLDRLRPTSPLVLANPVHLRYLANYFVEAISQHADFSALLVIQPDGSSTLFHDSKMPKTIELTHVDKRVPITWYTGQEPGQGPRELLLGPSLKTVGSRIHDSLADPMASQVFEIISELRRRKDPDEVAMLSTCMRASEAGHAWCRSNLAPGMSELDLYSGVTGACLKELGHWATVYGDFTVTNGKKRGGPPTPHILRNGETFILDFSVIVQGYRSDFTNTFVVGGNPSAEQKQLFDLCVKALDAGERKMAAGVACQSVYDAIRGVFAAAGLADQFPTHGGHGLGLAHPEAPFVVRHSTETLVARDVVTLEPGLYLNENGLRIENNYLITDSGYERLNRHSISLT
jgi:Xaa-Pro dipeptidase